MKLISAIIVISTILTVEAQAKPLKVKRSLNKTEYGYKFVSGGARAGQRFQKFELRPGDCGKEGKWSDCKSDRSRSEVRSVREWRYGEDFWIGFSVKIPKGFPTSRPWTTIAQIHQNGIKGLPDGNGGIHRPNHMQLLLSKGRMELAVWSFAGSRAEAKTFGLGPINLYSDRWTDVQFHLDTKNGKGNLEVFLDAKRVLDLPNSVTQKANNYYFKYGIYISGVSEWGGAIPTQELYFDEVKAGKSLSDVSVDEADPVD